MQTAEDAEDAEEMKVDQITGVIVDAAMKIHSVLGPGLLESVYETCLQHELVKRGLKVQSQVWLPVIYDGIEIEGGYKIDLLVNAEIVMELKTVEHLLAFASSPAALILEAK